MKDEREMRLFRRLLRLFPAEMRGDFGAEMEAVFRAQLRDAEGAGPSARRQLWWRTVWGILRTAPREHWDTLHQDLRWSVRSLRRAGVMTAVAVVTLGVGVGIATAIFAVADGVLRRPLPYPEPERLVRLWDANPTKGIERIGAASGNVADWREQVPELAGLAGFYSMGRTLQHDNEAEAVLAAQVSTDFFPLLGVPAALGRTFSPEETARSLFNLAAAPVGTDLVAVLGHGLWQRRFGSDPAVLGRTILLDRQPFRIVGVMPPRFAMPGPEVELWIPWSWEAPNPRDQHYLGTVGRLRPGATLETVQARLDAVTTELGERFPETNRGWEARVGPLQDDLTAPARPALLFLTVAGGLLLVLAAIDLTGFQLVRASGRLAETTVRRVLGAAPLRIARQLLTESLLIGGAGAVLACLIAGVALAMLPRLWPDLPRLGELRADRWLFLIAILGSLAIAATAQMLALASVLRRRATAGLRIDGVRATGGRGQTRVQRGLVVAEVAVAVVLLIGAGLLLRSFARLAAVDPGFDPRGVVVAPVFLDMKTYGKDGKSHGYYERLFEQLRAIPGVETVGAATALPASPLGPNFERPVWAEEHPPEASARPQADVRMVTPDYFLTLGIPVRRGRAFAPTDGPEAPQVVIVNERLAARLWPGQDPVGRKVVVDYSTSGTYPYEVVGVVGDVRFRGPRSEPRSEIYLPHAQRPYLVLNVAVKTAGDPTAVIAGVYEALRAVDPAQPPQQVTPLTELVAATMVRDRLATELLGGFGLAAVVLAALGIYGVLAHRVSQRGPEIRVRLALGASPARIAGDVCGEGLWLAGVGGALGLLLALAAGRLAAGLLFEIASTDPLTFATVLASVLVIAWLAAVLPARRAAGFDPTEVLR